jgi:hypothetical protein
MRNASTVARYKTVASSAGKRCDALARVASRALAMADAAERGSEREWRLLLIGLGACDAAWVALDTQDRWRVSDRARRMLASEVGA